MNFVEKNGQPSMEEILASIRRIIADEPQGGSPFIDIRGTPRPINLLTAGDDEDQGDFELPSIFRPQPLPEKPAPLFGRLTDAIRSASSPLRNADEPAFDPYLPNPGHQHQQAPESIPNPPLSMLNITRIEPRPVQASDFAHLQQTAPPQPQTYAAKLPEPPVSAVTSGWFNSAPAAQVGDVKREMVPFCDQRMSRMGAMSVIQPAAAPEPVAPTNADSQLAPVDLPAIGPGQTETVPAHMGLELWQQPEAPSEPANYFDAHAVHAASPEHADGQLQPIGGLAIEDATADLLRPMLRQWLAENMPRMVEKALHIEVAESVRTGRKPLL